MQNVVIIGFGFMGQLHAQVYRELPGATLAGVVDKRRTESEAALQKLACQAPVHDNLESLLASGIRIDAVDICLPTDLHLPAALEAIAAKKHVFCEKPIATSIEAAAEMTQAARHNGVQLMVGQCIRFWPEYLAITDFVRSDRGGRLVSLNLQRYGGRPGYTIDDWVHDEERCRGAALDMHIHDTDYLHHLLGAPKAVFSRGVREPAGWNYISTQYLYGDNGPVVTAEGGWLLPPKWGFRMSLKAVFENAAIDFDSGRDPTLTLTLGDSPPAPMPFKKPAPGPAESGGNIADLGGYYNELVYFIDHLEENRPIDINTGDDATASLRTVLAEIESARTGKILEIP